MSDFFQNDIVQGVLATLFGILVLGIFGLLKFKRDEKIVTRFLQNAEVETKRALRTTHAISSATSLSEERTRKVCSKSAKIKSSRKEKGSWKLS